MKKILSSDYKYLILLPIIIFIHFFILNRIVYFPYPELFIYPYLVAKGLLPYKQIIDQHFPGLMFFPLNLYTLGINTPQTSFILHLIVVGINHLLIFMAARKYFGSSFKALMCNLVYLIWQPFLEGYVLWIDSFMPIFFISAYYLLIGKNYFRSSRSSVITGFILGLATVFKQTTLPLFFLITIYFLKKKKVGHAPFFVAGFLIPIIFMVFYFIKIGVIYDFFYWTITFNLTTFAQMGRKYPTFIDLIKTGWIFWPAFILITVNIWRKKSEEKFLLLYIFFLASLMFAFARFDFVHLQPALPFLTLLVVQFFTVIPKRYAVFLTALYITVTIYLLNPFYRWASQGRIMFFGDYEFSIIQEVGKFAKKGDVLFAFGTTPHLYYLTDTLPPGRVFVFQFPWFMVEAEEVILEGIINDPPKVVVRDANAVVENMNLVSYMPKISQQIEKYYTVKSRVNGVEIMLRN